ncbi:MAG: hypothetical protein PHO65_06375 [Sulfurovum sp.]|nr:hypothetical protein [Sulfurovum sp.]
MCRRVLQKMPVNAGSQGGWGESEGKEDREDHTPYTNALIFYLLRSERIIKEAMMRSA